MNVVTPQARAELASAAQEVASSLENGSDAGNARARARKLAEQDDSWGALAALYEELAAKSFSTRATGCLLREGAELYRIAGLIEEAEACYRKVLGIQPDDAEARERLESLCEENGRWPKLAAALEERVDPRLGPAATAKGRAVYLRRLADVYSDELHRPREAAAALERLSELGEADAQDLERLAEIHASDGRWRPAALAMERLADMERTSSRAREARRRAAEIYEQELRLPRRAEEVYQALLRAFPDDRDAYHALASHLERRQQWNELDATLRKLTRLTKEAEERVPLLRRRARILIDHLARPSEGTALLRRANALSPRRQSLTNDLSSALRRSGQPREALALLENQAKAEEEMGSDPRQLAAILLQIASVRFEELGDRGGARRTLERLLERVPGHAPALHALAALEQDEDPHAYARTRLREAEALENPAAKARALIEAANTLRDRLDDQAGARAALERAVALVPDDPEVVTALAHLLAEMGDLATAEGLLERLLDTTSDPPLRAQLLTELAELAVARGPAYRWTAERRLLAVLEEHADHLPALRLLAVLFDEDGRHGELAQLLSARLPSLNNQPPAAQAEIERRLGEALEELGQTTEAYEHLRRANKLSRNDLLTKIALGENCFRAGRWREAALHFRVVLDHDDAPNHAVRAAVALAHAAVAEVRGLRPDRAPPLYEAALRLDPDCVDALRGLADIERARGNLAQAAELYERDAAATVGPERHDRLEKLGDFWVECLDAPERASEAYAGAVRALSEPGSSDRSLIEKLLGCQRQIGDLGGAGTSLELLAGLTDHWNRGPLLLEAAEAYREAGDTPHARFAVEASLSVDPLCEPAVALASELQVEAGDFEAARSLLARALYSWERIDREGSGPVTNDAPLSPSDEARRARRATLWTRLGSARKERGDTQGALAAYQRAVEVSPGEADAVGARYGTVELLRSDPAKAHLVKDNLLAIVRVEPKPRDVLELARVWGTGARSLRSAQDDEEVDIEIQYGDSPIERDRRLGLFELAAALGEALSEDEQELLRERSTNRSYRGRIDRTTSAALFADAADAPLAQILGSLAQAGALLWPRPESILAELGYTSARRIPALEGAAETYARVARALGAPDTLLYATDHPEAPDVAVACAFPPLVILGPRLMSANSDALLAEQRFVLGRAAELVTPARLPAMGLPPPRFELLVAALDHAFGSKSYPVVDKTQLDAEARRLRTTLPVPLRARLTKALEGVRVDDLDPARFRAACHRAADRSGFLAAADLTVALRLASERGDAKHLVELAISDAYFEARASLGLA